MRLSPIQIQINPTAPAGADRLNRAGEKAKNNSPRFGLAKSVWEDMFHNLVWDTVTVLLPKTVVDLKERGGHQAQSKAAQGNWFNELGNRLKNSLQLRESWILEWLENVAFYVATPVMGQYVFGKIFSNVTKTPAEHIGTAFKNLKPEQITKGLIGGKAATIVSVMAFAMGWEFLVQHAKNWITAEKFNAKNFTAVASLEDSRQTLKPGEIDPVARAKKRFLQVGLLAAGALAFAGFLPKLILKNPQAAELAKKAFKVFDFKGVGAPWGMSRAVFAAIVGTGVASYLDAARSWDEFKEVGSRLLFVAPNLIFGQDLLGTGLGYLFQNTTVGSGKNAFKIADKVPFIDKSLLFKDSFLSFNQLRPWKQIEDSMKALKLDKALQSAVETRYKVVSGIPKYLVGSLGIGMLLTWLTYSATRHRFEARNQKAKKETPEPVIALPTAQPLPKKEVLAAGRFHSAVPGASPFHQAQWGYQQAYYPAAYPAAAWQQAAQF